MIQSVTPNTTVLLADVKAAIVEQDICSDLAATATQVVFGEGNPSADIVFIGEAPGKNEDMVGRPFVGAAGKFLDELLQSIKLSREDVYITNIVKYRPPENRDPLPTEKAAFLPFLYQQLQIIQPKLLVTLGRHSMESFLPGVRISEVHGQPKRIKLHLRGMDEKETENNYQHPEGRLGVSVVLLPLYHPAAALYNGGLRDTLQADFAKIPEIIKKLEN